MSTGDFQDFFFTIFWTPIAALQFMWLGTPVILLLSCILMGIFDVDKERYQLDDGKYFVIASGIYVFLILLILLNFFDVDNISFGTWCGFCFWAVILGKSRVKTYINAIILYNKKESIKKLDRKNDELLNQIYTDNSIYFKIKPYFKIILNIILCVVIWLLLCSLGYSFLYVLDSLWLSKKPPNGGTLEVYLLLFVIMYLVFSVVVSGIMAEKASTIFLERLSNRLKLDFFMRLNIYNQKKAKDVFHSNRKKIKKIEEEIKIMETEEK
jgi:hypothetical protein